MWITKAALIGTLLPVVIPAAASAAGEGFRRLLKWRTGCEGRISHLKRRCDLHRTRLDRLSTRRRSRDRRRRWG
jgi:hypothetical protein